MNQPLAEMLRYNTWANAALLQACRALGEDQLAATGAGTSGSLRELLTHIVGAQQTLVLRTKGRQNEGELNRASPWPGLDVLAEIAAATGDELTAIAEAIDPDAEVDLRYLGKTYRYPKSFFLVHAVAHGVEHRSEIKLALAQLGIATPDLDGWAFAAAMGYGREV